MTYTASNKGNANTNKSEVFTMKMIFVANEHLATALQESLAGYFDHPDTAAVDFCYPDHEAGTRQLAKLLSEALDRNPAENFLILADAFGSTAYNETSLLLSRTGLTGRAVIVSGMNLPLAIKYYGLKDIASIGYLHELQEEAAKESDAG